ncbi:hypothetical protein HQ45_04550 [Porphyromonas crevioricanis]|uniref:Lipoprotein-releasing system transmembrane protein lolE n=1 Tax=Porphyromonas crevioricanis TaxID=393921 RepID=A0A0A2G236_9PORP|nr:FtsX-like permease family protein [Porphyromonas crevioricanis]KGN90088.1 hypothetical protein HQ45_04550 [Porphyromonas crevioricanis]KGN94549.1 hypothetical protein HQ38_05765 [Porphyromonas crevioricanis]GAD08116.1 hypothetical protein PORCAN_1751 [Porphyromonas crevioricanis JCM 13913]SQH72299.1 Lipoprotein-releasing system transmembrane protein lolE [Porphyromonas crevioricanis]
MKLPLFFAGRYLFSRKSLNAVNIVSAISAVAVAVVSMALLLALSIYNGYEQLILSQTSGLDPDLLVERVDKQSFELPPSLKEKITAVEGVETAAGMISQTGLLRCKQRQTPATVIGVEPLFSTITDIDQFISDGEFQLIRSDSSAYYNIGSALAWELDALVGSDTIDIYFPKRIGLINPLLPASMLRMDYGTVASIIQPGQAGYDEVAFIPIDQLRYLLQYTDNEVTAIGIKLQPEANTQKVSKLLENLLGSSYKAKNREAQYPEISRLVAMEKWITFLILLFILILALFNVISSLAMLLLEKKKDIVILRALGMRMQDIQRIFVSEGVLVTLLGALPGLFLGAVLAFLQQEYGIVEIGSSTEMGIPAYPVELHLSDFLMSLIVISSLGWICAHYAVRMFLRRYR